MNWISVDDRLPEKGDVVLITKYRHRVPITARYGNPDKWYPLCWRKYIEPFDDVTHWMPLPGPPEHKSSLPISDTPEDDPFYEWPEPT